MLRMNDAKRRVVIAIKTTGYEPDKGDRMTEIACVELMGLEQTGNNFHAVLFPGLEENAKLLNRCGEEFKNAEKLQPGKHAEQHTIAAMRKVPGFTDKEAIQMAKLGMPAYMIQKMHNAPEFREIETKLMNYLRMYPDTVIVTHNIGHVKEFFRKEMTPENWKVFANDFHNPKHGMMQKVHKLRPAGLFPTTKGSWMKGLGFDQVCTHFEVPTEKRTRYSAMQDALMLAELVQKRKEMKMLNINLFPKSKSHPDQQKDHVEEDHGLGLKK